MQNQDTTYQNTSFIDFNDLNQPKANPPEPPVGGADFKPKPADFNRLMMIFFASLGTGIISLTLFGMGGVLKEEGFLIAGGVLYAFTIGIALWATIVVLKYFYRAWSCVDQSVARATPGKAIGYLFIPFFNIYWAFNAYAGLAKDYNKSAELNGSPCVWTKSYSLRLPFLC